VLLVEGKREHPRGRPGRRRSHCAGTKVQQSVRLLRQGFR
jgi:hypothetical protein